MRKFQIVARILVLDVDVPRTAVRPTMLKVDHRHVPKIGSW